MKGSYVLKISLSLAIRHQWAVVVSQVLLFLPSAVGGRLLHKRADAAQN